MRVTFEKKREMELAGDTTIDFSAFSSKMYQNYVHHGRNLKELCTAESILKPSAFFESLEKELKAVAVKVPPSDQLGSVAEYGQLFQVFDDYPSNLQKIPKKRDLQRANSSTMSRCAVDATLEHAHSIAAINTSTASLSSSRLEDQRSSVELYNDFKQFQQKLRHVYEDASVVDSLQTTYLGKIAQLQTFAQQLEKLMPGERETPDAFTASEEAALVAIAENMEQLNYLREHGLHIQNPIDSTMAGGGAARLESLVDVLTYTLRKITCYINA